MGKKPADQTSNQPNGSGDAVNLETELDDDNASGTDSDDDEDDDADSGSGGTGGGNSDVQSQIDSAVEAAVARIERSFQSEIDRRVNGALAKVRGKGPAKKDDKDEDEGEDQGRRQAQPAADVRGARIAFREYLPDTIKLLSAEERQLATDFGQNFIRARAFDGFDDEDTVGQEAASATAEFLKKARTFYSARTKRVLQKQGALVEQGGGQSPNGGGQPDTAGSAFEAAKKKDMELFPERYVNQQV